MKRLLILTVIIGLLFGLMPLATAAQTCTRQVTVWDNESLNSIAAREGVSVADLAARNNIAPNARLLVGQVLCLDGIASTTLSGGQGGAMPPQQSGTQANTTTDPQTLTTPPQTGTGEAINLPETVPAGNIGAQADAEEDEPTKPSQDDEEALEGTDANVIGGGGSAPLNIGQGGALTNTQPNTNTTQPNNTTAQPQTNTQPNTGVVPPNNTQPNTGTTAQPQINTQPATGTTAQPQTQTQPAALQPMTFYRGQVNATLLPGWQVYTVVPGDTLTSIGTKFGVTVDALMTRNNIPAGSVLFAGETLLIPPAGTTPPPPTGGGTPPTTPGLPPTPGVFRPAPGTIPIIGITPMTARPGATVTVSGSNYPGSAPVTLYLEKKSSGLISAAIVTVTTNADGTFSTTLTIPGTWSTGATVNQPTVSISGYSTGGYWAMNFFINIP
jgi:LysM repeat protein